VTSPQVSFVQYSDEAKTEFRLNAYQDKGIAMSACHQVRYRGGNTKTGQWAGVFEPVSVSREPCVCELVSVSLCL